MPSTYDRIATSTLGSSSATIDFTSISSSYTHLRLVVFAQIVPGGSSGYCTLRFNSDTGTNYSDTELYGNGTSASSYRNTNATALFGTALSIPNTTDTFGCYTFDIFNYTGSTNKTVLCTASSDKNGSGSVDRTVGLWRNTAAITSIRITTWNGTLYNTGTKATLYGIVKA